MDQAATCKLGEIRLIDVSMRDKEVIQMLSTHFCSLLMSNGNFALESDMFAAVEQVGARDVRKESR